MSLFSCLKIDKSLRQREHLNYFTKLKTVMFSSFRALGKADNILANLGALYLTRDRQQTGARPTFFRGAQVVQQNIDPISESTLIDWWKENSRRVMQPRCLTKEIQGGKRDQNFPRRRDVRHPEKGQQTHRASIESSRSVANKPSKSRPIKCKKREPNEKRKRNFRFQEPRRERKTFPLFQTIFKKRKKWKLRKNWNERDKNKLASIIKCTRQ